MQTYINRLSLAMLKTLFVILLSCSDLCATSVQIYSESQYLNGKYVVPIYADINDGVISSFCVKLQYDPIQLEIIDAEKNENLWYFGTPSVKVPYLEPDTTVPGEVILVGAKLDEKNPLEGVSGQKILLGTIKFKALTSDSPSLSLTFGREKKNFSNFVTPNTLILDNQTSGVIFESNVFHTLSDVIMLLQLLSGQSPGGDFGRIRSLNGNSTLGLDELLDIFQRISGLK